MRVNQSKRTWDVNLASHFFAFAFAFAFVFVF